MTYIWVSEKIKQKFLVIRQSYGFHRDADVISWLLRKKHGTVSYRNEDNTISLGNDVHQELIRITETNGIETYDETIKKMITLLKEYQKQEEKEDGQGRNIGIEREHLQHPHQEQEIPDNS